jgi:hypothetical protein
MKVRVSEVWHYPVERAVVNKKFGREEVRRDVTHVAFRFSQ